MRNSDRAVSWYAKSFYCDQKMSPTILGVKVYPTNYGTAVQKILSWARSFEFHYICAANVHMLMEARDNPDFREIVNSADMVTPDGMPLVWMLRLKGHKGQPRVYGPTLMLHVLEMAAQRGIPVGFYGGEADVVEKLVQRMGERFQDLKVTYAYSPPFRELTPEEDAEICQQIQDSGARLLFVGLGCPKQERWMAAHRDRIPVVMIGVGAAFDFHAGVLRQAPDWIQGIGLEWLYRFFQEPGRLWKRYLIHNPRFILLAIADLLGLIRG